MRKVLHSKLPVETDVGVEEVSCDLCGTKAPPASTTPQKKQILVRDDNSLEFVAEHSIQANLDGWSIISRLDQHGQPVLNVNGVIVCPGCRKARLGKASA
jgi:hypothetical protein